MKCRTSVEDERDLSKSWPSGSTESGISDLWQSRQSRSAEAELHIFGSPGRGEIRKWTYPYLEVLVEQVREKNEIFRSPGRAEVRKAELLIFGSKNRAELRKSSFRPLKVLEVWKQNFTSLTGPYPTDCHCQCWRITLLTTIIVIPNEGQCEDQVWLKHKTFAMLLTRLLYSRRGSR